MKRMALLLTFTFVSMYCMAAFADSPQEIASKVSPSVVLLVMEDTNGQPLSMGSGFVVRDGVVATNMHVIEGAARGYAKLISDKTKHDIRGIVASDAARDLVLLSVDSLKANALAIGDSNSVAVGDTIYAVGNPRGLEGTFSAGIVSSVRRIGEDSLLQITAPISPGSSGGPVVNSKGEVIGVAVATFKGGQNLNFAISSGYLSSLIPAIKAPVDLPNAAEARKAKNEKSIFSDLGGRSSEGVEGGSFTWDQHTQSGEYSFSIKNKLRDPVKDVYCLVVFYDAKQSPIDVSFVRLTGTIPGGLAKRVNGSVAGSVEKLNTPISSTELYKHSPPRPANGKIEFRILYFEIANPDEPIEEQSAAPSDPSGDEARRGPSGTARVPAPASREEIEADLRRQEERVAEAAAKIAPAGDGPDLIESRIEGEFHGWDGESIFKLANGQIWQQVSYAYTYHYAFRPEVTIIKTYGAYKMKVDGIPSTIFVERLK